MYEHEQEVEEAVEPPYYEVAVVVTHTRKTTMYVHIRAKSEQEAHDVAFKEVERRCMNAVDAYDLDIDNHDFDDDEFDADFVESVVLIEHDDEPYLSEPDIDMKDREVAVEADGSPAVHPDQIPLPF